VVEAISKVSFLKSKENNGSNALLEQLIAVGLQQQLTQQQSLPANSTVKRPPRDR
jgi:hypothetical protein